MVQATPLDRPRSKSVRPGVETSPSVVARFWDLGLIIAFLALTFLLGVFPLKDTDFWWHLKTGDIIRQTGQIPTHDTFTFGAEGQPWVDLHWIFQVGLSWGFEHGGVVGLNLAKCAITSLAVGLLITARRRDWPVWAMLLAWIPALLVLNGRMYIRPETVSLLYLSIVLAILFRWARNPWLAFGLPLVEVCWVNTQGLFLLEPILIGFALLDAAIRPGAFSASRRRWWRIVGAATALTSLACLVNPYGLTGALYPIQLASTMSNPIFRDSIGELTPLPKFIESVGLDSLPLRLHLAVFGLGLLSFVVPMVWRLTVILVDRDTPVNDAKSSRKQRGSSKAKTPAEVDDHTWRPPVFRGLMFAAFSALSLAATRNSHQFAAVVGTVTAWNFGEWVAAIRARRQVGQAEPRKISPWPRLITFVAITMTFTAVASGRFYAWSGEGRTVGIGEEPLWFPHEAVKFAGGPGMPDRLVGYHNGHPALFEYYWAPGKKTYTDARLEVMGPNLYKSYLDLGSKIANNTPGWAEELEKMGRPSVLIDNLDDGNATRSATLLNARHWRCVWFDPVASLFVHDTSTQVVGQHGVDFAAKHFQREAQSSTDDPATLAAMSKALRHLGTQCRARAGGEARAQAILMLGLDYAMKLREVDPGNLNGWKQAGIIEHIRDLFPTEEKIPRFRLPFDPVFDLPTARSTYELTHALAIDPSDGTVQYFLSNSFQARKMDEVAAPLLEKFSEQPNRNIGQQRQKALAADELATMTARLGAVPSTRWANLSELETILSTLLKGGRPATAADVMESAYRPETRPWDWADRMAILRLHLGQPEKARAAWIAATVEVPAPVRSARIAATYLVEGDFESARKSYQEAIAADASLFEAHYGLALLEQDDGHAAEATAEARRAEKAATNDHSRSAARLIFDAASPYANLPESIKPKGTSPSR